ncbi:MAG: TA system VapC family ribonuclease toxin [Gemmatimonadota bacterium]
MRVGLPDLNVLIALAWPNHVHHQAALSWFERNKGGEWATTPFTQAGFVRLSSNELLVGESKSPGEAMILLGRIVALPGHVFWTDDISIVETSFLQREKVHGYRQVTDAHLLALALRHGGRLITMDRGVRSLVPDGHEEREVVCVLQEAASVVSPKSPGI